MEAASAPAKVVSPTASGSDSAFSGGASAPGKDDGATVVLRLRVRVQRRLRPSQIAAGDTGGTEAVLHLVDLAGGGA